MPLEGVRIVDGSGLSRYDRSTARALGRLLVSAWNDASVRTPFFASLAIAGVDGTLSERMRTGPARGTVRAKTGTGWTPSATTVEKIRIIAETVRGRVAIKASGGIRSLETIREMVALGVTRFGINTRTAVDLVRECAALPGGRLVLSDAA